MTKPPVQYFAVGMVDLFYALGAMSALGMCIIVISFELNWRMCFYFGALIAVFGTVARRSLRETPEFVDAKLIAKRAVEESGEDNADNVLEKISSINEEVSILTSLSAFLIQCAWPICFYFVYIYCGNILKHSFGYSPLQVIRQNFVVSLISPFWMLILAFLSQKVYPLKILKVKLVIFFILIFSCPYLLSHAKTPNDLSLIQMAFILFGCDAFPAVPILMKHFPVFKRFTYTCFIYAFSRMVMSPIISFGLVYLIDFFGDCGLLIIMVPCAIGFAFGVCHFEKLDIKAGNYKRDIYPDTVAKTFV
jgi:hypothetical protein